MAMIKCPHCGKELDVETCFGRELMIVDIFGRRRTWRCGCCFDSNGGGCWGMIDLVNGNVAQVAFIPFLTNKGDSDDGQQ